MEQDECEGLARRALSLFLLERGWPVGDAYEFRPSEKRRTMRVSNGYGSKVVLATVTVSAQGETAWVSATDLRLLRPPMEFLGEAEPCADVVTLPLSGCRAVESEPRRSGSRWRFTDG
jgi:hypothetical protein